MLLHIVYCWKDSVHHKLRNWRTVLPPHCAAHIALMMQVEGTTDLLYGYVPAVFLIGCQVRGCHWGRHTNSNMSCLFCTMYVVLSVCTCTHTALRLNFGLLVRGPLQGRYHPQLPTLTKSS